MENSTITTASTKPLIFLVDDSMLFNNLLEEKLNDSFEFNVLTFLSGETCLNKIHLLPDIVFLDYDLSGTNPEALNGVDILKKINTVSPQTKVVMLTGNDKGSLYISTKRHNAFDFLLKDENAMSAIDNIINQIIKH